MPPAVHLSALHASLLRTSSGDAETISRPRNAVYGAAACTCSVSSGSIGVEANLHAVSTEAVRTTALERNWWLRAPAVLVAPRAVFASLRDESEDSVEARQEPIVAIAALAGIAVVLVSPTFRRMLNDPAVSLALVPVLAFVAGALYAAAVFWLGGGLLFGAARRLGGEGTWRRARHVPGLASAPLALSPPTFWPLRVAVSGQDLLRPGGACY